MLPGIDDGPEDIEQSLEMARAAVEVGIATIVSTPHLRSDFPDVHVHELAERCHRLREALEREGIPLELVCGAEVSLVWALEASDEELELASVAQRGADLLLETPSTSIGVLEHLLYELRLKGYRITLAHPERTADFRRDPEALRSLVDQGALLQLNADSLVGSRGMRGPKLLARELLLSGLAHTIASDGHRGRGWRPVTRLPDAVQEAAELVGIDRAHWMTKAHPRAIVDGAEPPTPPPAATSRRRRRRFRFGR